MDNGNPTISEIIMKLTLINRLKLCFEILTVKGTQEKKLSTFRRGYDSGFKDKSYDTDQEIKRVAERCADLAERAVNVLSHGEAQKYMKRIVLNGDLKVTHNTIYSHPYHTSRVWQFGRSHLPVRQNHLED